MVPPNKKRKREDDVNAQDFFKSPARAGQIQPKKSLNAVKEQLKAPL